MMSTIGWNINDNNWDVFDVAYLPEIVSIACMWDAIDKNNDQILSKAEVTNMMNTFASRGLKDDINGDWVEHELDELYDSNGNIPFLALA